MKILFCILAFLGLFKGPEPINTVKLLAIGGDFHDDAVVLHINHIAQRAGKEFSIDFCNSVEDADFSAGEWDAFIVSQSDAEILREEVAAIRKAAGRKSRILLWQTEMDSSKKLAKAISAEIVPAKCAVSELESYTHNGDAAYEDGELTAQGYYTLACTLYEVVFKTKVFGSRYSGNLSEESRRSAQLSADAAVKKPYKICLK